MHFIVVLLQGQMNTLNKMIKGERIPILRNLVLFPILVSLDRDELLEVCRHFHLMLSLMNVFSLMVSGNVLQLLTNSTSPL